MVIDSPEAGARGDRGGEPVHIERGADDADECVLVHHRVAGGDDLLARGKALDDLAHREIARFARLAEPFAVVEADLGVDRLRAAHRAPLGVGEPDVGVAVAQARLHALEVGRAPRGILALDRGIVGHREEELADALDHLLERARSLAHLGAQRALGLLAVVFRALDGEAERDRDQRQVGERQHEQQAAAQRVPRQALGLALSALGLGRDAHILLPLRTFGHSIPQRRRAAHCAFPPPSATASPNGGAASGNGKSMVIFWRTAAPRGPITIDGGATAG